MADERGVGILDGADQPLGHLGRFLCELRMHRSDYDIYLREYGIGEVELAIGENVDFYSGKNLDAIELLRRLAYARDVFDGTFVIETVGEGEVLGVIGDGHVFIAARSRSLGHLLNRTATVGFDRVHVHVALDILLRNQIGQGMLVSGFDFTRVFPQFRRDIVKLELGVDLLFRFARHRAVVIQADQAVFTKCEAHLQSALAKRYIVRLRSGEILHGRTEGLRGEGTNVHLHA